MNSEEAYEKLGLSADSDIETVRSKFNEMYNDYRVMIDNAPTPKLRSSFERNLSELEEAFKRINGSETLDTVDDLPVIARTEKQAPQKATPDSVKAAEVYAYFGCSPSSSPRELQKKYATLVKSLENEIKKQTLPQARQIYEQELEKITLYWAVLLRERPELITPAGSSSLSFDWNKYKKVIWPVAGVAALALVVVLLIRSGIFTGSLQEKFDHAIELFSQGNLKEAEVLFLELNEEEEWKANAEPWLQKIREKKQEELASLTETYMDYMESSSFIEAYQVWKRMDAIETITDPDLIIEGKQLEVKSANLVKKVDGLIDSGNEAFNNYRFESALSTFAEVLILNPTNKTAGERMGECRTKLQEYAACREELLRIQDVMSISEPADQLYKMAQQDLKNVQQSCPGLFTDSTAVL